MKNPIFRKTPLLIFIFLLSISYSFPSFGFAQHDESTQTKDTAITWEKKYSDELSIILLKERTVELKKDWSTWQTTHLITKVQKEGAKELGEVTIDYEQNIQEVKDIKAFVITPDGKKLKAKSIQDLNPYSGQTLYLDNRTKIITLPNVIPGSIIDWQVTIVTKKPIIKDAFFDLFTLTSTTPIKTFQYKLIVPKGLLLKIANLHTESEAHVKEEGDKIIYTWHRELMDKFEPEEDMPPLNEFYEQVLISSIKDWKEIATWYWGLVTRNLKISQEMKDKVRELTANKSTEIEKIQAIKKYIQDNFRYVSMSFGTNRYEPHSSDEVFANKYGDCKDQTLVFMALLKEIGIASHPALFCSENVGDPKDKLPMSSYFNHVILGIELQDKLIYTDILQKGYRLDELPKALEGGYVLLVNDKRGKLDQLPILDESEDTSSKESIVAIKEDGSALVEVVSLWPKDFSIETRENWKNSTEKQKKEFLESLDEIYTTGGKILERKWENMDSDYGQIKSFIRYERPQWAEMSGDYMVFGIGGYERAKEFTKHERVYPIMFRSNSLDKTINTYILPKGYEIVSLPRDIQISNGLSEFSRIYRKDEGRIVETEMTRRRRARLPASHYEKIKDFYNKLAQLSNEKIIIKRERIK